MEQDCLLLDEGEDAGIFFNLAGIKNGGEQEEFLWVLDASHSGGEEFLWSGYWDSNFVKLSQQLIFERDYYALLIQ